MFVLDGAIIDAGFFVVDDEPALVGLLFVEVMRVDGGESFAKTVMVLFVG